MMKTFKVTLTSLVVLLVLLTPACRTKKKPVTTPPAEATATVPDVPPPPVDTASRVTPTEDFVKDTPGPTEVEFPNDIEELNRFVQREGYVRDAFYNYDEATLDDAAQTALSSSATWLKGQGSAYNVLIEGHCDERGTEQYNLALGDRRANSAREYLMTLGVDGRRIRTVSYGEERPFEEGHDDSSMAQNRRSHIVLVR